MRILLINPPNSIPLKWNFPLTVFQPLGLAYIAAVLEKEGYKVKILDALALGWQNERIENGLLKIGLTPSEIEKEIKNYRPDVVGISFLFSSQEKEALMAAELVKKIDKNIFLIAGGPHATILPSRLLLKSDIDCVILGEGEITTLKLINCLRKNQNWKEINGIAFKENGKIFLTKPAPFIENLDLLPFPARHLLPMDLYFKAAKKIKAARSISTFSKRWATIITSRGCPFNCIFCSIHHVMGYKFRARSPENVIAEIEELVKTYKIQHLDIEDDNFTLNKERAKKILNLMKEKKFKISWSTPNGIRADTIDEDLIKKMKETGCIRTIVAPESGNQFVIDEIIKKKINLEKVEEVVKWAKKYKLLVEAFFVLGFPGETINQMEETIKFAKKLKKLGVDDCAFYLATPFYGTELFKIVKEKKYLKEFNFDKLNTLSGEPLFETEDFTKEDLKNLWEKAKKINPIISKGRIKLAISLLFADPKRAFHYFFLRILRKI